MERGLNLPPAIAGHFGRLSATIARGNGRILRRIAVGGFWSLVGDAGARVLALATAMIVARYLGVAGYGEYTLVQSTLAALMAMAQFGMGATATRSIAACRTIEPHRVNAIAAGCLTMALLTGLVSAIALFIAVPWIAADILRAPSLIGPLHLASPLLLIITLSGTLSGLILGFEAFQSHARVAWASALASFIGIVAGTVFGGVHGAVAGIVVAELIRLVLLAALARKIMREHGFDLGPRSSSAEIGELAAFGFPVMVSSILHAPILWLCQALVARTADGLHQIGLYDAALKWMTVVILVPLAASAAFPPVLANIGTINRARFRQTTFQLAATQIALTSAPALVVALAAPWLLTAFGDGFAEAVSVVRLMMLVAPVFVLKHLYWQILMSTDQAWASLWISVLCAAVALSTAWLLRTSGALGLASAMLTSYGAALVASVVLIEWQERQKVAAG